MIVDAAENLFVPVCIYNNTKGDRDAAVRKRFKERAWNNPVVRILDPKGKDLLDPIRRQWTVPALADRMAQGLAKAGATPPPWLRLFAAEQVARRRGVETAVFGMG